MRTSYTTRKDNRWAKENPDEIQQMYIMTSFHTAVSDTLEIHLMDHLYPDMLVVNTRDNIQRWQEVIDRTTGETKEMVDIVHEYGKEAMMFMGDHWIGMEPFMDEFASIGLDAVVGSVGNGATLRLFSDIKNVKYTEGRFLPYFFQIHSMKVGTR